jgi:hypothetical protein
VGRAREVTGVPENKPNPRPVEAREESEGRGVRRSGQWGYGEEAPRAHDQDEGAAAAKKFGATEQVSKKRHTHGLAFGARRWGLATGNEQRGSWLGSKNNRCRRRLPCSKCEATTAATENDENPSYRIWGEEGGWG